jgi:putative ABC transport system permease protein
MSPVEGRLVGIVAGGSAPIDQAAFLPLERVQWMADTEDGALELLVYGSDRDDAQTLAAAVAGSPGAEGLVVQAWSTREPLASMSAIGGAVQWMISGLIITLCALAVWNTMTMSVRERTGEIGVLRALGMTAPEVVGLFVLEGVLIALLGGAVGAALGGMGGLWLESHGISFGQQVSQNIALPVGDTLRADMTWGIGGLGLVVAVVTALVGTAVPAIAAAAVQPVEAMRARR